MFRRDLLRGWTAIPLAGRLGSWLPLAGAGATADGPNAAVAYGRAFRWAGSLGPEESTRLRDATTIRIDDQSIEALIRKARPALEALREAAAITRCRWGAGPLTSDDLGKGHLDATNLNVVRVACLSARRHARSGRGREALDDVFAGLAMAHRVGAGGFLFARILECGGEIPAFQTLGRILPGLDPGAIEDLSRRLGVMAAPEPASAAVGPESWFILDSLRARIMEAGPVVVDGAGWARLGFDESEAATLERLTGGDWARLLAHLEATASAFAELARRLDLPRPGCRASLDEFAEAKRLTDPIAVRLVESFWGVRHVVDRMQALRAMLRAGIALVRGGENAFRAEPDPFGTGAFGLERRGGVSVIRSALNDPGKPEVSLEIGEAS